MPLPRRLRAGQRPSPLAAAMAVQTLERAIADGNAMSAQGVADRSSIRSRVTALETSQSSDATRLTALEARPVSAAPTFLCTGGRASLTGLKGLVPVVVTLTTPMPDTTYIATATFATTVAGVLPTGALVVGITAQTTTTVTVQVSLSLTTLLAGAWVNVVAVKG